MNLDKFERYDRRQQLKQWEEIKNELTVETEKQLIRKIMDEGVFGYLDLVSEILFEIASDSEEYVKILEDMSTRVKNDLAQGPFLSTLIKIGKEKTEIGMGLRNKIIKTCKDSNLMVLSGLILGGIGIKNKEEVLTLIEQDLDQQNNPTILQSYLKAILIINENKKRIDERDKKIIAKLFTKNMEQVNIELLNFSLANYSKNKSYFYKIIKSLTEEKKDSYKKFLFRRLSYQNILEENKLFELIELAKDAEEEVLNEIAMCLRNHPSQLNAILDLYFYWINKGLYFKIRNFEWILEEIMKKDNSILPLFIKSFRKIDEKYSYVIVPDIFQHLVKYNIEIGISEAIKLKSKNKIEKLIKSKLLEVIIGCCYSDKKNARHIQELAKYLLQEAQQKPYINIVIKSNLINSPKLTKEEYNILVDKVSKLLEDLRTKKEKYDFNSLAKTLKKYPIVNKYGEDILRNCKEKKIHSPLLRLLDEEEPDLTKIKIREDESKLTKAIKLDFLRSQFWPKAYLTELNNGLSLFEKIKNPKYDTKEKKKKYIRDMLLNEQSFWGFLSELIVMNRLGEERIKFKDRIFGNKDIDIETEIFNKPLFFEITHPRMDRKLRLANKMIELKNRAFSIIENKYKQIMKSGVYEHPEYMDNFYFYVVIDISGSMIDEYDLLDSLFGTLKMSLIFNKKTGEVIKEFAARSQDSLSYKNKKTETVSGVIYFKEELGFRENLSPYIKLNGKIINNPFGTRVLSEKEMKRLNSILFGT